MASSGNPVPHSVRATMALTAGIAVLLAGCSGERIAELEKNPMFGARSEGTGIQFTGLVVLAKYQATAQQKAAARQKAATAVVRLAKPQYDKRRAVVRQKIDAAKAQARTQPIKADHPKEVETLKRLEAELASLDSEWQSLSGGSAKVPKMNDRPAGVEKVSFADAGDREALDASISAHVPQYVAVAVPQLGIASEKGAGSTVMLWDTRRHRLVGEQVYVLNRALRDGEGVKLDGVSARFASTN